MVFPDVDAVHVIPSEEYATRFVPEPPTTHRAPFQAIVSHIVNREFAEVDAVQVIPSDEYASVFVPWPVMTNLILLQATFKV
jgi:hypothetical protein